MSNLTAAPAQSAVSTNKARSGVTGHRVRYVLGFGLVGIVAAFVVVGIYFGFGF